MTEQINNVVEKVKSKFSKADLSIFPEKYAIQFNLTGKIEGVFYVEVLNGNLSVQPYEYNDKDGAISVTKTNLEKVITGSLSIEDAIDKGKIACDGDMEKIKLLSNFIA